MTHSNAKRTWLLGALALFALAAKPAVVPPQTFPTPEAAVDALGQAAQGHEPGALLTVFGSDAEDLLSSGDPVADENSREAFEKAFAEKHSIEHEGDSKATLVYGDDDFPFPVPLVKQGDTWHFDSNSGRDEILARRVGRNELSAIQVCLAYVDAQREYSAADRDGDGTYEYAQSLMSSPGKHDGLYWPTDPGQPQSPMGALVADAQAQGYTPKQGVQAPYHGYLYKMLLKQGKHAPDGAFSYIVRGNMIGGFALVAYPAEYGVSGIMTFIVNYDGIVYSKNLGPKTGKIASAMTAFDPDSTWKKEE